MLPVLATVVALMLTIAGLWWLRRRRRRARVIELGIGRTRPLRPEEREGAADLVRAVRRALRTARSGRRLVDVEDFPLAEVRASVAHAGCFQVRFRRQITFVPFGETRPRALRVDWGPRGLVGSSTTEITGDQAPAPHPADGPPQPTRSEPEALAFIDRAMREQGDFGVYGDVRSGLTELHPNLTVEILEQSAAYWVTITPEDGHGHFLAFSVDRRSGALGEPMAGHLDSDDYDEDRAEREHRA